MRIQPLHAAFKLPAKGTPLSGGYDLFMPEAGVLKPEQAPVKYGLGFKAEVPTGYVAVLVPRSGKGFNFGVDLNNTLGVIDEDYRGEWFVKLRLKSGNQTPLSWEAGDSLVQMLLIPVLTVDFKVMSELSATVRGEGGIGHTGH